MPAGRSAASVVPRLTLGALHSCLLDRLDTSFGMRVAIHFEERTSVVTEHAGPGKEPASIEQRTFDADVLVRKGIVERATMTAGAMGAATLTIHIADVDGTSVYSIAGERFGALSGRPAVFDPGEFASRLDDVPVTDAVIDQETPDGSGRIVVDADVDNDSFERLLRIFGGSESGHLDLPLLSHSVVLSAASDVTLDYWWSLLGLDEVEGRPARHNVVVCHVQASFTAPAEGDADVTEVAVDPELPILLDLDAVWELARQRRTG